MITRKYSKAIRDAFHPNRVNSGSYLSLSFALVSKTLNVFIFINWQIPRRIDHTNLLALVINRVPVMATIISASILAERSRNCGESDPKRDTERPLS